MATVNFATKITTFAVLIVNLFLALMVQNFDALLMHGYRPPPGIPPPNGVARRPEISSVTRRSTPHGPLYLCCAPRRSAGTAPHDMSAGSFDAKADSSDPMVLILRLRAAGARHHSVAGRIRPHR